MKRTPTNDLQLLTLRAAWDQAEEKTRQKFFGEEIFGAIFSDSATVTGRGRSLARGTPNIGAMTARVPIARFLEACTVSDRGARERGGDLYKVFVAWAKANGECEATSTAFGRSLAHHGFTKVFSHFAYWVGVRLVKTADDFANHAGNPLIEHPAQPPRRPPRPRKRLPGL